MSRLAVRLASSAHDRHVTRQASGLSFTKTAPGGHHSARVRLNLSRHAWGDIAATDRLYIYDPRDGATIWEGYTTNPTPSQSDAGEGYDLAALGGMTLASDDRRALIYVDREQTGWARSGVAFQPQSARTEWTTRPNATGVDGLLLGFSPGQPIGTGMVAEMGRTDLVAAGMELGAIGMGYLSGTSDAGYLFRIYWNDGTTGGYINGTTMNSLTEVVFELYAGVTLPTGVTTFAVHVTRTGGATNVADDDHWTHLRDLVVLGRRMNKDGSSVAAGIAGMIRTTYVLPHEVVADLVGRMLGATIDQTSAVIDTSSVTQIDQLAYRQPVTVSTILNDLMSRDPDYLWEILESNTTGLHRFAWRQWPTTVRYEVPTRDWSARGGDVTLANRLAVNWTENNVPQTITAVANVPALGNRIVHADPVTLPAGRGSLSNAQQIGAELLAARANPPLAGTAAVRRPILDLLTGRRVDPWRIEPGYLVRLRETGDELRLTELNYDDENGTATLTLGEPSLTDEQRIARLSAIA